MAIASTEEVDDSEEDSLTGLEELDEAVLNQNSFLLAIESADEVDNNAEDSEEDLDDLFAVEELDDSILDKNSNLLAIASTEDVDDESEEDNFTGLEELDEAILNQNSFLLAIESADEVDNNVEDSEDDLDDIFAVEELDDSILDKNSNLLEIASTEEVDDSEEDSLTGLEKLDEAVLNQNSFLLAIESADEVDNNAEDSEEELDDLFAVEELDDSILDKNSNLLAIASTKDVDDDSADNLTGLEELDEAILNQNSFLLAIESADEVDNNAEDSEEELEDIFAVEELDDSISDKNSNLLAIASTEEVDDESEDDLTGLEELDEAILNQNSFLLAIESADEVDNNAEDSEDDLEDIFAVEELDDSILDKNSNLPEIASTEEVDDNSEEDNFAVEELDNEINNGEGEDLEIETNQQIDEIETSETETISFSEYCFIRNKRLLESELLAPKLNIANLVSFFHELSQENKNLLLPILNQHFKEKEKILNKLETDPEQEQFKLEIKEWLQQITELSSEETRKAAIWFSRYCFDPEETIAKIETVFEAEAAKQAAKEQTAEKPPSLKENKNSYNSQSNNRLREKTSTKNQKFPTTYQPSNYLQSPISDQQIEEQQEIRKGKSINILVPIIWTAVTLIFVIIGIVQANSNAVNAEGIPVICENIINPESTDHCQLTVDLVGQKTLEGINQEEISSFPNREHVALYLCRRYANVKAGIPSAKANPKDTSVINSRVEEILPGIYIAEAEQKSVKEDGNIVRVACTFANLKKSLGLLASDIIPNNWPSEKYQGETSMRHLQSLNQSLGIYSIFVVMGFGTLFTAIGLFVASMLDWGITITSMDALYKSAFILGALEVAFSYIPIIGFFGTLALKTLTLGISSAFVKGFEVNWSDGYPVVCLGTVTILGIRSILHFFLILLISSFIP